MRPPAESFDTSAEASELLVEGWRRMTPARRARLVDAWSTDIRALAEIGVRRRRPSATSAEALVELGRQLYGASVVTDDVAAAVLAFRSGALPRR